MPELSYKSVRFIKITSTKLAITHYVLQGAILVYVLLYSIILEKGYQEFDTLVGTTWIKPKGTGSLDDGTVYDAYDVVKPPLEANAIFLAASTHTLANQTRGICPGNNVNEEGCTTNADCINRTGQDRFTDNGLIRDVCDVASGFCMLDAWCPPEPQDTPQDTINNVKESTIRAVANIVFPKFGVSRTTSWPTPPGPLYPEGNSFFRAEQFVTEAGFTWDAVEARGAIVLVTITYDCDLNQGEDACEPTLEFTRLDVNAPGFNYRYITTTIDEEGLETRALSKVVGLRVLFQVNGRAGRFSMVPLLTALGAGMALLSFATIACDFLIEYVLPGKETMMGQKYEAIDGAAAGYNEL